MTNDKGILIRNIYYMLTYAFQELKKNTYEDIDKEDFEHIQDMFAEILFKGVSMQLKQGLYKEYVNKHDNLPLLKGKLDINGTISNRIQRKTLISCEFDELSEDNIFNRILKTTAVLLTYEKCVSKIRKTQLRSLLPFFDGVTEVEPAAINWSTLRFQRSNQTYRMLMNICYFILDGMLLTTEKGNYRMATFSDEHMNRLFEKFVLNYYKTHHKEYSVNSEKIEWDIDKNKVHIIDFLPDMKSDITIRTHEGKILVIDTKYYARTMQEQFNRKTIHSGNMYQIFSYVKNMDKDDTGDVSGMLLYAKTEEDISPDMDAVFGKNRILVKTLDLNNGFKEIKAQLESFTRLI